MPTIPEYLAIRAQSDNAFLIVLVGVALMTWGLSKSRMARSLLSMLNNPVKVPRFALHWIMGAGGLLRLPNMFSDFWYDEAFTYNVISVGWDDLHKMILTDVHPPLPYLLQWIQGQIAGYSEFSLRTPSLLFGLLSICLIYRVTKSLGLSKNTALVAAALTAVMPMQIWFSNEARSYTLLFSMVMVVLLSITEHRRAWFLFAGLLPFIHAHGFLYLGLFILVAIAYRHWMLTPLLAGALGSLWLPFAMYQSNDVSNGFWLRQSGLGGMIQYPWVTTTGYSYPTMLFALVFVAFTLISIWHCNRWILLNANGRLWLIAFAGVPFLTAVISYTWSPIFLQRALLPAGGLIIILWAKTLTTNKFKFAWARVFLPCLIITTAAGYMPTNAKETISDFFAQCDEIGPVYTISNSTALIARYYSERPQFVWYMADDISQHLSREAVAALNFVYMAFPRIQPPFCLPFQNSPYVNEAQRQHIAAIQAAYNVTEHILSGEDNYYQFILYEVK